MACEAPGALEDREGKHRHARGPPTPFRELPPPPARASIVIPGSRASAQEPKRGVPPGEPAGDLPEVTRT